MSATLFFDFEPPIDRHIETESPALFKIMYGDLSGQLSAEELLTLRSFVVHLSDEAGNVEMRVPAFSVERAIRALAAR
jgi:hypothetical protein